MKSITVLKLKVASGSEPLEEVALLCRHARNAAIEDWLLRQRGKPESPKQAKISPRPDKDGNPRPLSESTKIYHAITAAAPDLGTTQASMLSAALNSQLGAKVDWRRGSDNGKRPRRRDAILNYEDRPPFFTGMEIPLHNAHTGVSFGDRITITIRRPVRKVKSITLELSLRDIPPKTQLLLRDIASGSRKLADSKLLKRNDNWYWHLPVVFEAEPLSDTEAVLFPTIGNPSGRGNDRPFRLQLPGRTWYSGDGRYLLSQTRRLIGMRKAIGWRYRNGMVKGHGRQKIDKAIHKRRQQQANVAAEVRRQAIADIIRQCERQKCGKLLYREPSLPLRKKCWFEFSDLEFDWTRFGADLKNAAARRGIEVTVKQWKWKDAQKDGFLDKKEVESDAA